VNFNHFYNLTQNILCDALAQSLGTDDVLVQRAAEHNTGRIGFWSISTTFWSNTMSGCFGTKALWESPCTVSQNIKSCRPSAELDNACQTSTNKSADSNIVCPFYAKTVGRLVDESILNCLRLNFYGLSNIPPQFRHWNLACKQSITLTGLALQLSSKDVQIFDFWVRTRPQILIWGPHLQQYANFYAQSVCIHSV